MESQYVLPDSFKLSGSSFGFAKVSPARVEYLLRSSKSTSVAVGQLPSLVLNVAAHALSGPLSFIINLCVENSYYPSRLKLYRVIPLHKAGDKDKVENYRPISIVAPIGKIFEHALFDQIQEYFDINNIISESQFGFRAGYSISIPIVKLTNRVKRAIDKGKVVILTLLDLKKAFDSMSGPILCKKLEGYGCNSASVELIGSFLRDRIQFVDIDGTYSDSLLMSVGVPQGSFSGPLLFKAFINDLPLVCEKDEVGLLADDTNVLTIEDSEEKSVDRMNVCLKLVTQWFDRNCMTLNESKSKVIRFCRPYQEHKLRQGAIMCNLVPLEIVREAKFLGIWFDQRMNGEVHIDKLKKKLSGGVAALIKTRFLLNSKTLRLVYHAFFTSHLVYGVEFYGLNYKNKLDPLLKLQKRALRIVLGIGFRDTLSVHWREITILPVPLLVKYIICLFIFKSINGFYFNVLDLSVCSRNTRGHYGSKIILTKSSSEGARQTISNMGATVWNDIPDSIRMMRCGVGTFKRHLKSYFISQLPGFLMNEA
jgi:hypothetical protein